MIRTILSAAFGLSLFAGTPAAADLAEIVVGTGTATAGYGYRPPTFAPRIVVIERDRRPIGLSRHNGTFGDRPPFGTFVDREVIVVPNGSRRVVVPQPIPELDPIGRPGSVVNLLRY